MQKLVLGICALALCQGAFAAPRFLISHYAPTEGALNVLVNEDIDSGPIRFGDTDSRYRLANPGVINIRVTNRQGVVVATREAEIIDGDYSAVVFTSADGSVEVDLLEDRGGLIEGSAFNAKVRIANYAAVPEVFEVRTRHEEEVLMDGLVSSTGRGSSRQALSPIGLIDGQSFRVGDGSTATYTFSILGNGETFSDPPREIFADEIDVSPGAIDAVIVGDGELIPYQTIIRSRPGNRFSNETGLYGVTGGPGSGAQITELPEEKRVFGVLFTFNEFGESIWYYFDSSCEGLLEDPWYRFFACTTVNTPGFSVTYYEVSGGLPQAERPAAARIVGFGEVNLQSRLNAEGRQQNDVRMTLSLGDLEALLDEGGSFPDPQRFEFSALPGSPGGR